MGDVITVEFSEVVNKGCYQGCPDFGLTDDYLKSMISFEDSLWAPAAPIMGTLTGRWMSDGAERCSSCKNGTAGVCKKDAVLDLKTGLYLDVTNRPCVDLVGVGVCPTGYSLCNSKYLQIIGNQNGASERPPTIDGLQMQLKITGKMRNYPASIGVISGATTKSAILRGNFGPPCVTIDTLTAYDPIGYNGDFTNGDTISIRFNQPTNRANGPVNLNQNQVLEMVDFFCNNGQPCSNFANSFQGTWMSRQELRITVTDVSNSYPYDVNADPLRTPLPGDFYVKVKEGIYLLNFPPACLPNSPTSSKMVGTFGPSNIAIISIEADDPRNIDKVWSVDDTLRITLSRDTDYAGRGKGPWSIATIDQVFRSSCPAFDPNCKPVPFGEDYSGIWWDRRTFQITVVKPNKNITQLDGACPYCEGKFEVKILASGNLRHFPPTSDSASTCGGPNACPEVGSPTSLFWGPPRGLGCTAAGLDLSTYCEKLVGDYGTPFPKFESLIGRGPSNAISKYVAGSTIKITFTEYANLGACQALDIAQLVAPYPPCSVEIGTCSITISWVPQDDSALLKLACTTESGSWVSKRVTGTFDNCQLPQRTTRAECDAHADSSPTSKAATWTPGLAPHQSCSDATSTTFQACQSAGHTWRVHETDIPQSNILLAMDFSERLGSSFSGRWLDFGPIQAGICTVPCAKVFELTVHDVSTASPPEFDLFKIRMNPSRGIAVRRSFESSPGSDDPSEGMQGDFGPPTVSMISLVAGANPTPQRSNARGPLTGLYEEGSTIAIGFDQYTNRGNFSQTGLSKQIVDTIFRFTKNLGSDYTGHWTNCSVHPGKTLPGCQTFVITIKNATGASPPTVFGLQATLLKTGNIRNYPSASAPANGTGPIMQGHFGPSSVYVEQLIASDPRNLHSRFDVGDRISLLFNMPTNKADMVLNRLYNKNTVDKILKFSSDLAVNYTGTWKDNSTFIIDITEINSHTPLPIIGTFKLELIKSGNLRNYPPTCDQSDTVSVPLSGGFGLSTLFILTSIASDPEPMDTLYSDGDKITITFSQRTNKAGLPDGIITKEQLNNLFHFSMPLGDSYQGSWISDSVLEIDILNSTKPAGKFWCEAKDGCSHPRCSLCALQTEWHTCVRQLSDSSLPDAITNLGSPECPSCDSPLVFRSRLTNNGTASCRFCPNPIFQWMKTGLCIYKSDGGYDPPLLDTTLITVKAAAELREVPPILSPSTGIDETGQYPPAYLKGGFGYSVLQLTSLVASDPDSADSVFSAGDAIIFTFSEPTNRGNMPETAATKGQIDRVFEFSHRLGNDYVGHWPNRSTFVLTIIDSTQNGGPTIGGFYVRSRADGKLRNYPPISEAAVISGNAQEPLLMLKGEFGPSTIYIKQFRASFPGSRSDVYNVGAAFTIFFNEMTNLGGLRATQWTKAQIDNAFDFYSDLYDPHPLGSDYSGRWIDNATFIITILALDRDEPKGPPPLSGGNFRVSVRAEGNIRNTPPQCAATVINTFVRAQKGLGGPSNLGINCDCCSPCHTCEVCDAYSCKPVLVDDQIQSTCSNCCGSIDGNHCCRILSGNYGKLVSLYDINPARIAVTGQLITINGHGFDGRLQYNKASVGGRDCPVLTSRMDEKTKDGFLICKAPDGIGSDVKAIEVEVFDYSSQPPSSVKGFCCKVYYSYAAELLLHSLFFCA